MRRLALALTLLGLLPAVASANTIAAPGQLLVADWARDGNCGSTVVWQYPSLPGATGYALRLRDHQLSDRPGTITTGPEHRDDGPGNGNDPVGPPINRIGLTGIAGPGSCGTSLDPSRFTIYSFRATMDDRSRIVGQLTHADGTPASGVAVRISGPTDATARTDRGGVFGRRVRRGRYTVTAPSGYCATGRRGCERSRRLTVGGGTEVANFRERSRFTIQGTIRDEFRRGLGGVRVGVTGPSDEDTVTDAAGRYTLHPAQGGTYELTARAPGRPRGPQERYFVTRGGAPTNGTAADVTLTERTQRARVDWELDRRLQFSVRTSGPLVADGFANALAVITARTQRGDPAPGVRLAVDPSVGDEPRAVICSAATDPRPLWPSLLSGGSVSPAGLPAPSARTDAAGRVAFTIYAGTRPGSLAVTGQRQGDPGSSFAEAVAIAPAPAEPFTQGLLQQELPAGSALSDEGPLLAFLQTERARGGVLAGAEPLPVAANGQRAMALFQRGRPPAQLAGGRDVVPDDDTWVLTRNALAGQIGRRSVPTLREWSRGGAVGVARADRRTYLGWPLPAPGGAGACLSGAGDGAVQVEAHSPVRLRLPRGTGIVLRRRGVSYALVPRAARLTMVGTGRGPVTLVSRSATGLRVARFTARKGRRGTLRVRGGLPGSFRFGGTRVTVARGMPLVVRGLPRRLRAGRRATLRLRVTDALGRRVTLAVAQARGATAAADRRGRIVLQLPGKLGRGRLTVRVAAPAAVARTVALRVR